MSRHRRAAISVYVRNLHNEVRSEDLKKLFSKYGDISDVYVPLDHFTREPRGFAYVQFDHRDEADDAIHTLDGTNFFGRNIEVLMAQGDRKTPGQMRYKDGPSSGGRRGGGRSYSRSRSRSRSPRRKRRSRTRSRTRSPSPRRRRDRSRSRSYTRSRSRSRGDGGARRRSYSRSRSPARSPGGRSPGGRSPGPGPR